MGGEAGQGIRPPPQATVARRLAAAKGACQKSPAQDHCQMMLPRSREEWLRHGGQVPAWFVAVKANVSRSATVCPQGRLRLSRDVWGGGGVGMQSELGHCGDGEEGEILRVGYW